MTPARSVDRRNVAVAVVAIVAAATAAYCTSFSGVLVFDDEPGILRNPSIRHLWTSLLPPVNSTLGGRPLANLSFAINYALSGTRVWSYHAVNLLIHVLAGLTLFGICRRTFARRPQVKPDATLLAFFAALFWTLHPIQTESVTYVVQRVESLMALFYLLTFYAFVRSLDSIHPRSWRWLAVGSCLLGVGAKEVTATAPLLLFLFDRTFVSGTFRDAWARRRGFYLALAATWLPLAALVASTGWNRGGTTGFDVGIAPWSYWTTQFRALARYLELSLWPRSQVFDYPAFWVHHVGEILWSAAVVVGLAIAAAWALKFRPAAGFLGAWFFVILAPTSVVPSTVQMIVEHRMYLPLAAVAVGLVYGMYTLLGRRSAWALLSLAAALGCTAAHRSTVYWSAASLWSDTLAKCPNSDRAHNNLGTVLVGRGDLKAAIAHFQAALLLRPSYAEAHYNLGNALREAGRNGEAIAEYEEALQIDPKMPDAETSLGIALEASDRVDEAMMHFKQALRLDRNFAQAHEHLGVVLAKAGRLPEAITHLKQALRLQSTDVEAHNDLGNAFRANGQLSEALAQYEMAIQLQPTSVSARHNLANALAQIDRVPEAIAQFEQGLSIDPERADIRNDFGMVLLIAGRTTDAITQFERALRTNPNFGSAHLNLAMALESIGRMNDAAAHYEEARRLGATQPGH